MRIFCYFSHILGYQKVTSMCSEAIYSSQLYLLKDKTLTGKLTKKFSFSMFPYDLLPWFDRCLTVTKAHSNLYAGRCLCWSKQEACSLLTRTRVTTLFSYPWNKSLSCNQLVRQTQFNIHETCHWTHYELCSCNGMVFYLAENIQICLFQTRNPLQKEIMMCIICNFSGQVITSPPSTELD
jgi:hypothetical protein